MSSVLYTSLSHHACSCFFFFNDTATTEIYTLSLHDALPICGEELGRSEAVGERAHDVAHAAHADRKSTRLNSSHGYISYAVFCLKKKKKRTEKQQSYVSIKQKNR